MQIEHLPVSLALLKFGGFRVDGRQAQSGSYDRDLVNGEPGQVNLSPDIEHDKLLDTDKGRIPPLSIGKTLYFRTGFSAFFFC